MNAPQRGEVLREVAKEVLDSRGQEAVGLDIACGDIDRAAVSVAQGVDLSVIDRRIDPERARVVYVLLGLNPQRFDEALARFW